MAVSRDSTVLPRRAVLAGAVAAMSARVLAGLPASAEVTGDPAFTQKSDAFRKSWAEIKALFAENERRIKEIGPAPQVPQELLTPLDDEGPLARVNEWGWDLNTLKQVALGMHLRSEIVGEGSERKIQYSWRPVSPAARKRAAKLLPIRESYDDACAPRRASIAAIEATVNEPLDVALNLAEAVVMHPASTAAELAEKVAIVRESDLFNCTDSQLDLCEALCRDTLALAEKVVTHVDQTPRSN